MLPLAGRVTTLVLLCSTLLFLLLSQPATSTSQHQHQQIRRLRFTGAHQKNDNKEEKPIVKPGINNVQNIDAIFSGHRIGLITNPSGVAFNFTATIDILFEEKKKFQLVALFSPEHGLRGDQPPGQHTESYTDPITGLPVFSLYGSNLAPTKEQVKNLTMLVFDLQDVGVRCFTYMSTLAKSLQVAAQYGLEFAVIDRLNPIGASDDRVDGPVLQRDFESFIGIWTIPLQHGMTMGELATMFNDEMGIHHENLHIMKVRGVYGQRLPMDSYALTAWLPPSPNLPSLEAAFLYPGTVLFESLSNVSLGRGTATPFQIVGAPFMNPYAVLNRLNELVEKEPQLAQYMEGVTLVPAFWIPSADVHKGVQCAGVRILVTERSDIKPIQLSLIIMRTLMDLYPNDVKFSASGFNIRMGYDAAPQMLNKTPLPQIFAQWKADLVKFMDRRAKYIIYK